MGTSSEPLTLSWGSRGLLLEEVTLSHRKQHRQGNGAGCLGSAKSRTRGDSRRGSREGEGRRGQGWPGKYWKLSKGSKM